LATFFTIKIIYQFQQKIMWATFWTIFSQTQLLLNKNEILFEMRASREKDFRIGRLHMYLPTRVAKFFLVQTYQNGNHIPNDHKLYIPINYSKIYPNLGFLVCKQTIWQPWYQHICRLLQAISEFGQEH
jgi:hypothetical protein